ncbi:MAG: M48 family metalloprotease [Phycisphaerales bacterium]|nr:MAG: M48 family metalloprotease [Phycisphaerales bacterium]
MHLLTILAFACLFWQAEQSGEWVLVAADDVWWTLIVVIAQPILLGLAGAVVTRKALGLFLTHADNPEIAQHFHHRSALFLRTAAVAGFAISVFLTRWPEWFAFGQITPALQILGDLIVVAAYSANMLVLWITAYPMERTAHREAIQYSTGGESSEGSGWRFGSYIDFHVRHYLLIVAVPMLVILFVANMTRGYSSQLQEWGGWSWTPETILGAVAFGVFILAPAVLRRVWRTKPLEAGAVRAQLEAACERIGLRCREILLWDSHGLMINAAVMGVVSRLRYVLLSDALVATMDAKQIESVFGHEAGHVRHRHIQYFLLFAYVGWLVVAGVMELVAHALGGSDAVEGMTLLAVEGIGVLVTAGIWWAGFGWLSRRFERQADLAGAHCVTPPADQCSVPCSVHPDKRTSTGGNGRLCATGAAVFASALDRVALLNGIPHEEHSWRHSSIGSRIRFLASAAGDPELTRCFERTIRRVKSALLITAVVGSVISAYYWMTIAEPAILQLQAGVP